MRNFFRRHPRIHASIHWVAFTLGGLVEMQDRLLGAVALFPADSKWPHDIAFVLGVVAFSNVLVGRADKALEPAAPAAPASEAVTQELQKSDLEASK